MRIKRERLYRLPWSKTDNPGGWVEVTDECDLKCPGCYRHTLEGHRPLEEVKADIIACKKITGCDGMAISGGEPLIYPHIVEVVDFISGHRMKPVILTNGEKLTWELAKELKKAGLTKFHFHIDSAQERPGWTGKNEVEMNELRQHYADLIWKLRGIQCGFNVTVFRQTLQYLPEIVKWCRQNIHKVHHLSLIAFRGLPSTKDLGYVVNGQKIDLGALLDSYSDLDEISISSDEMLETISNQFPDFHACAYLNGTTAPEANKFLIIIHIGSKGKIYGGLGAKGVELAQVFYHFFKRRYCLFSRNQNVGKKIFGLFPFDREVRKAFLNFLLGLSRNPLRMFYKIYVQPVVLEQPLEIMDGKINLCDGCVNTMVYKGKLINSCRLDEYRLYGAPIIPVLTQTLGAKKGILNSMKGVNHDHK